ncbi:TraB/GumN family protein [Caulobacter sp.]|uniref:TraB/GumN family protein n=1 Tax=Caulobacter sp. TaxID=78 RepID=UPI003BB07CA8
MSVFRFRKRLVAVCALACALAGASAARAAPAMWEVRDHDTRIYLFGAMHVLAPNVKWRTRAFDRAYAQADKIWFETRADADPVEIQALVDRYGVDPERPLSEKLPPRTVATLKAALERDGGSLDRVDRLRPWAAAMMLSVLPMTQQGGAVQAGADAAVTRQARAADKPIATFETLEQQIQLFAGLPEAVEVQYLDDVASQTLSPPRNGVALQAAWLRGDMTKLGPLVVDVMKRDRPALYDVLLKRRNEAWVQALVAEMAKPGVELVAVGALHMAGEDGLPALMAARGFQVRRVQ